MNEQQKNEPTDGKKISLAEMVKRKLEQDKAAKGGGNGRPGIGHQPTGTKKLKSQMTKKVNNQKKRTGV